MGFTGAEVEELEALANQAEAASRHLGGIRASLTASVGIAPWVGHNADVFRDRWGREHGRSIADAQVFLREAGRALRENARQQREASAAGSGGGLGVGGLPTASWPWSWFGPMFDLIRELIRRYNDPSGKPLFENGVSPGDIFQGKTGDCWLLASLGALARTPAGQEYLKSLIRDNKDGTYTVMFADGHEVTVHARTLGGSVRSEQDKWVLILENAFAERHGGLDGDYMNGNAIGNALEELGLANVQARDVAALSDADLTALLTSGQPVVASADLSNPPSGFTGYGPDDYHAFSVVDATNGTVTLRNPWGSNSGLSAEGVTLNSDGTFTVSLADFRRLFYSVDSATIA